ncbi:hypothetical protein K0017_08940 [Staphylococcus massiliensis]|uniref:hypothetical protein n=1 Tax=Staphylococcus massiliensis TaxID=555791 RepID=UPI001EE0C1E7|nr:hypothetical protein [Staphylococcus massiliensis]MCG3402437.1 hypothetical protein [Staphylococcus massiliensis]
MKIIDFVYNSLLENDKRDELERLKLFKLKTITYLILFYSVLLTAVLDLALQLILDQSIVMPIILILLLLGSYVTIRILFYRNGISLKKE